LQIHDKEALTELVDSVGGRLVFLPPYSPEYNPIEHMFSKLKGWMQTHGEDMAAAADAYGSIDMAMSSITAANCRGWVSNVDIYNL
jgi:hypothetical protein